MALPQISVQVEFVRDRGMTLPGHNHEWFMQEPLMANAIAYRHRDLDGKINRATRKFGLQISALDLRRGDRHAGRGVGQAPQ